MLRARARIVSGCVVHTPQSLDRDAHVLPSKKAPERGRQTAARTFSSLEAEVPFVHETCRLDGLDGKEAQCELLWALVLKYSCSYAYRTRLAVASNRRKEKGRELVRLSQSWPP